MMTDPIADLLNRIRNALMAGHETAQMPYSRIREEIVRILKDEGYLIGYSLVEHEPVGFIKVILKYQHDRFPDDHQVEANQQAWEARLYRKG